MRLGMANSRMKDFCDLWMLSNIFHFDGITLAKALLATFERRRTELPTETPIAFTEEFTDDKAKQAQWTAFVNRSRLSVFPNTLNNAVGKIQAFLMPPTQSLRNGEQFCLEWNAGGPWKGKS